MNPFTTNMKPTPKGRLLADVDGQDASFLNLVNEMSRQTIQRCYQCIKCTSGCPVAEVMDYPPDRILKMVQLGMKEEVLTSNTIWLCAMCKVCAVRCPNNVSVLRVMYALREIALRNGVEIAEKDMLSLHHRFLDRVKEQGRLNEFPELVKHRLKSLQLFADAGLGIKMFTKGKFTLKSNAMKNASEVKQIFQRYWPTRKGLSPAR